MQMVVTLRCDSIRIKWRQHATFQVYDYDFLLDVAWRGVAWRGVAWRCILFVGLLSSWIVWDPGASVRFVDVGLAL